MEVSQMEQEPWIVIATDEDGRRLAKNAEKLRRCYPEKYDIQITLQDLGMRYALSVRHRE
jgi:hypothetical protein